MPNNSLLKEDGIVDLYPSITDEIMHKLIELVKFHAKITPAECYATMHSQMTTLYEHNDQMNSKE